MDPNLKPIGTLTKAFSVNPQRRRVKNQHKIRRQIPTSDKLLSCVLYDEFSANEKNRTQIKGKRD